MSVSHLILSRGAILEQGCPNVAIRILGWQLARTFDFYKYLGNVYYWSLLVFSSRWNIGIFHSSCSRDDIEVRIFVWDILV